MGEWPAVHYAAEAIDKQTRKHADKQTSVVLSCLQEVLNNISRNYYLLKKFCDDTHTHVVWFYLAFMLKYLLKTHVYVLG